MPEPTPVFKSRPRNTLSLELVAARVDAAEEREGLTALVMQRIEKKLDGMITTLGGEGSDQYGKPIGTGVIGRLMRLERQVGQRFRVYDGWKKYAAGAVATACLLGAVLWWALGDKIGGLLR